MKKIFSGLLSLAFLFLTVIIIQSCNNETKSGNSTNDTTSTTTPSDRQQTPAPAGGAAALAAGPFKILFIPKDSIVKFFEAGTQANKLLIEFLDTNNVLNAIAYRARNGNNEVLDNYRPYYFEVDNSSFTWDIPGPKILGNNELSKRLIKRVLNINGNINDTNADTLYLYPQKDNNNRIIYYVSSIYQTIKTMEVLQLPPGGSFTNPSPPEPPCNGQGCDQ